MSTQLLRNVGARLASLTLLIASFALVVAACDSGGDNLETTVASDSLQISNLEPADGSDLATADTSITFTFNKSVDSTEYTRTDVEPTSGNRHLIDAVTLTSQAKDVSPNGSLPVTLEFNDDRTQLTVTPDVQLQDGVIYTLDMGSQHPNDAADGTGFYDSRFRGEKGDKYGINPNLPKDLSFEFSIGINTDRPDVPSVSFNTEWPSVNDDGTLAEGSFDYEDGDLNVPFRISSVGDNVKGFEVYYRSQHQVGRNGNGDQFTKADLDVHTFVSPEADNDDFEEWRGIIPAYEAEDESVSDGTLPFYVNVDNNPFQAKDGAYGPIEMKVRAVSINNVRSEFTDVFTIPDNTLLRLDFGLYTDQDDDATDEELYIRFEEPVDRSTVATDQFTLDDPDGDVSIDSIQEINNFGGSSYVVIELSGDTQASPGNDVLTVKADGVTDLAGNAINTDGGQNEDPNL